MAFMQETSPARPALSGTFARTTPGLIEAATAIAICLLAGRSVYRRWNNSTLDAAPNAHWSVKFSSIWLRWHRFRDTDTLAVHDAHLRHGPVVRLAPDELSVCDAETGLKPIYGGRLPKTDFYQVAVSHGVEPSFALKDEESHRNRRRLVARPYTSSSIKNNKEWQKQQARLIGGLRHCLDKLSSGGGVVEVFDLSFAWALASISTFVFGAHTAPNVLNNLDAAQQAHDKYSKERATALWLNRWPKPVRAVLMLAGYSAEIDSIERTRQEAERQTSTYSLHNNAAQTATAFEDMKQKMTGKSSIDLTSASTSERNAVNALYSEAQDHIVAGLDTSQITLTICMWLLSRPDNSNWQGRLRKEVTQIIEEDISETVGALPVLDAILMETLRLYPVVAGCQPRVTTSSTVLGPGKYRLAVPAGVIVHAQAWTLHRSFVFENPEHWNPDRWLESTPEKKKAMEAWFWAFGSGSRRCLGEAFAVSSLKVALTTIYRSFETTVAESTSFGLQVGNILMPLERDGNILRLRVRKLA